MGRKRGKIKIIVLFRSYPTRKNKLQKNSKNSIIPILASFQAKIGWKRKRKRENRNYRSVTFQHDGLEKIQKKKAKKLKKIKKYHYGFISSQNRLENAKKERK